MFRFVDMERVGNIVTLPHSTEDKNSDIATHQLIQEMFKDAAKLEEERMDKFLADAEELHKNNEKEIVGLLKVMVDNSRANSVWETVEMIDEAGEDGIMDLDKDIGQVDLTATATGSSSGGKCPMGFGGRYQFQENYFPDS